MKSIVIASYPDISIFNLSKLGINIKSIDTNDYIFNINNILDNVRSLAGTCDIILVPVTKKIVKCLNRENIKCIVLYPNKDIKEVIIEEMKNDKIDQDYIREFNSTFNYMIKNIDRSNFYYKFSMGSSDNLDDTIRLLLSKRNTLGIDKSDFEIELIA